jgi:hypothetical protein
MQAPPENLTRRRVVGQFAVAALSERRNSLRIQDRRSETAATKIKLTHYRQEGNLDVRAYITVIYVLDGRIPRRTCALLRLRMGCR